MTENKKYKGVIYRKYDRGRLTPRPWRATICVNGSSISLGVFDTERKAAIAYDRYVIKKNLKRTLNILKKQ